MEPADSTFGRRHPVERRTFMAMVAGGFLAAPLAAEAQSIRKVAFLCTTWCSSLPNLISTQDQAFMKALGQAGFPGGRNLDFDMAGANVVGYERLPDAVRRLVNRKPDVILAFGNAAARAARRATTSIPIVMVLVADPVEDGLVSSLSRPGGNMTGLAIPYEQLVAKLIQLVKEINPTVAHVAVIWTSELELAGPRLERVATAIRGLSVQLHPVEVHDSRDVEKAFATLTVARPDALLLPELSALSALLRKEITTFALKRRLPTIAADRLLVSSGGLMSYGPYLVDVYERAAIYTAKVLRGVQPTDLPVEEPTRFELIISGITAKALGLTIPPSLLARADEVIQ